MTTNPTTPSIEQDAETVLRTIRTWKVPPSWADLWMHSGLPEHRLSAALRRLLYRTKQITCEGNLTEGWRYKTVTMNEQKHPIPAYWQSTVDQIVKVMRTHGTPGVDWTAAGLRNYIDQEQSHIQSALNVAKRAGLVEETYQNWETSFYRLAEKPKQYNTHIDTVVEAIRKSGGTADREAIWGRSPGLTWDEVDRAIEAAQLSGVIVRAQPFDTVRYFVAADKLARNNTPPPTPLTTFSRRALIDALLRGHHSITDAVIAAGEAWWQTADPLLRDLVANGEVNLQWSPPNGDTPGKMHYFKRKEAA